MADLRLVQRLGPWPTQPLVARADLDPATVAEVRTAVLAANDNPVVRRELQASAIDRFVPTADDHCQPVIDAMLPN